MLAPGEGGGSGQYTHGMDVAKVEDILTRLAKAKKDLAEVQTKSDGAARKLGSNWGGPDSSQFQAEWPKHSNQIESAVRSLETMEKAARKDVQEQRQASKA
jgi:uncharacterized protein YukE